jgi:DnaJ-class molecular chaperone
MSEENETRKDDDGFEDLNEDYYQVLKVSPRATPDELKIAYRSLAQRFHPDIDPKYEARFIKIANAYETLSDPELRNEYNKTHGHAYHEEVDINLRSEKYSFEKKEPKVNAKQKVEIGESSISIDQFAANRASQRDDDLKINHKIALTDIETLTAEDDQGERVAAWGELENAGESNRPGLKGVLGALRKRGNSDRRAKLKSKLKQTISDEMLPKQPAAPKARMQDSASTAKEKRVEADAFRGERIYTFQVSELEAALGATRTLVLEGRNNGDSERIEVDIPVGIEDDTMMEVSRGWERAKVKINVVEDPFFKIADTDVIMRIPITLVEAIRGACITIPIVHGNGELLLPKSSSAWSGVTVSGGGLDLGSGPGDAIVYPYAVPPKKITATLNAATQVIDELCPGDVRADWSKDPMADQYCEIDELSVSLFIPILFGEAIRGTSIDIGFLAEGMKATIPGPWDAKQSIVMAGKGPINKDGRARDLYIHPIIELPQTTSDSLEAALMAIEQHYLSDVRSDLPRALGRA